MFRFWRGGVGWGEVEELLFLGRGGGGTLRSVFVKV